MSMTSLAIQHLVSISWINLNPSCSCSFIPDILIKMATYFTVCRSSLLSASYVCLALYLLRAFRNCLVNSDKLIDKITDSIIHEILGSSWMQGIQCSKVGTCSRDGSSNNSCHVSSRISDEIEPPHYVFKLNSIGRLQLSIDGNTQCICTNRWSLRQNKNKG